MMKYFEIGLAFPYIVGIPGVFWGNFWLCILMGVSGSLALFVICMKIGNSRWLEFLGRHTMTIYLLQECVMVLLIKLYLHYQINLPKLFIVFIMIFATAFVCALIDVFIDKYAAILKGKI